MFSFFHAAGPEVFKVESLKEEDEFYRMLKMSLVTWAITLSDALWAQSVCVETTGEERLSGIIDCRKTTSF